MHRGFVKIYRKTNDWEWKTKPNTVALFVHILLKANYKDAQWQGIGVNSGQAIVGRKQLSIDTGLTEQQVRTALNHLKSTNDITIKTTNKYSIITVTNWDLYQADNQQNPNKQPTNNQQTTTSKEGKELKEGKEDIYTPEFLDIWEVWPRKRRGNKAKGFSAYNSALKRDTPESINNGIQNYIDSDEVKKYPKGCAAWFNDDRWSNDYTKGKLNGKDRLKEETFELLESIRARGGSEDAFNIN